MITFERINTIDGTLFNELYDQCIDILNNGSYPWHMFPPMNEDEKRAHIRRAFTHIENATDGVMWTVSKNKKPLLLCAGHIQGNLIKWVLGLSGLDENQSRAWLYQPTYATSRDAFWDSLGVDGWIMSQASPNKDVYKHVVAKNSTGEVKANVQIVESDVPGFMDIIVTKGT